MKRKQISAVALLSLLLGAGLAGGLYVINTPTKIAPRAVSPALINQLSPAKPTTESSPSPAVTSVKSRLSEQAIIDAFGTAATEYDLNQDGIVNTLDLSEFRKNH
ncbi:hypothetical protein HZB78_05085 [Candidatus Collierbacteria bacterium]|nr:hypothetical protein [Candidatus Collierbacteria bacterium]